MLKFASRVLPQTRLSLPAFRSLSTAPSFPEYHRPDSEAPSPSSSGATTSAEQSLPATTTAGADSLSLRSQIQFHLRTTQGNPLVSLPPDDPKSTFMNIPPPEDPLLEFLATMIMKHGKKAKASKIVSRTLLHIHAYTRAPPLPILREALFAISPLTICLRVKTTALKHIMKPVPLSERRSLRKGISWLLDECKRPGPLSLEERLAREIIEIMNGTSKILGKRDSAHKEAMLNKAYVFRRK
ncbi:ribosomal protein S7 domain-containing protein [Desarmillaria tabescens]|uniref:Ribosomal protein S7 domain-containing protein n=1 Tax=Armillaria tabescens TaxID=1929756 RepID=A0AA39TJY4_ARMTA|nr:ribosomal protein S7 domain-containing protein [Desarmillaria tabescens]KAK0461757.1 ribosomal protein S7 domain-containing protein [Desarmillaria tabescens]